MAMTAEIFAVSTAFFIALGNVLIRKGMHKGTTMQAIFISLLVNAVVFWAISLLFVDLRVFTLENTKWFLIAGIFAPGMGRVFNFISLGRIGVSRTVPITGIAPLFASLIAIMFLNEAFSFLVFIGIVLIMSGVYVLNKGNGNKAFDKSHILIPLVASLFYGLAFPLNKLGLTTIDNPLVGATITSTVSLLMISTYLLLTGKLAKQKIKISRHAVTFYILSGLSTVIAFTFHFNALKLGDVSIVAPLISIFPLFAVFLSHLFLKTTEKITFYVWLGVAIIVAGVALIGFI